MLHLGRTLLVMMIILDARTLIMLITTVMTFFMIITMIMMMMLKIYLSARWRFSTAASRTQVSLNSQCHQDDWSVVYSPCYQCHEVERTVLHHHLYQHHPKMSSQVPTTHSLEITSEVRRGTCLQDAHLWKHQPDRESQWRQSVLVDQRWQTGEHRLVAMEIIKMLTKSCCCWLT